MPLLDHFHPPLSERRHWQGFHTRWASAIADDLNSRGLPDNLFAEPTISVGGQLQVDGATFDEGPPAPAHGGGSGGILTQRASPCAWVMPAVFLDSFQVQII